MHAKVDDANDAGRGPGKMVGSVTVLPGQPGQAAQQGTPTATASATPSATPASTPSAVVTATAAPTTTPSAPKTGSGGLVSGAATGEMAVLWLGVAVAMLAGARVVSRRGR